MNRLSLSVLKSNRLFSVSLFLIYVIITVILVLLTFFFPSVNASIDAFLSEYGIADAETMTVGGTREAGMVLEQMDDVSKADAVLMLEGKTTLSGGDVFTLRCSTIPADSICRFCNTATGTDVILDDKSVLLSAKFAERHHVVPGDELQMTRGGQQITLTVTDIVTCPETILYPGI